MSTAPRAPNVDPDDPWLGFNLFDPEQSRRILEDPYPVFAHMREVDPVNETPVGIWRLTRYADVVKLLRESPVGVRMSDGSVFAAGQRDIGPNNFMLLRDPPDHTRLRKLVSKAFTPRAVGRLRERAEAVAQECVARMLEQGETDLANELALVVPATVICEMMGVPLADRDRFTEWTADATHLLAAMSATPEILARATAASTSLREYFEALIAERRGALGEDILSGLIRAESEGDRLSPVELVSQAVGLLIAGFETTIGLIGNGAVALMEHPDQLALLRAEPGRIAGAVEECLRYDGPIGLTVRITHAEIEMGGKRIPKDRMVWAILGAANRDPAQFADPDRFDITRDPNPHLAFGGGAHLCLGAHLARMEGQAALGALFARASEVEPCGEPERGRSLFRVYSRLPVRVKAA